MRRGNPASARVSVVLAALILLAPQAPAQEAGPVRYTEVLSHSVYRSVRLPGSVESRRSSVVASEVAGKVVQLAVQPGERLAAGGLIARLRTATLELELQEAQGRLREASARLDLAERNLARAEDLFDDRIVSQGDLDDAISERAAWQGRIDQSTAEIARIRDDLERCQIRAPFAGVVVDKLTEVGQWITLGGPVVEMVALDDIEVRVEVPERYYAMLATGSEVEVKFEALPEMEVSGTVSEIIPRANPQARSFPVKVRIANRERRIGVGMLAQVAMAVGERYEALLVPKDAVVRVGPQEQVFRIKDDGTVEPIPVQIGQGVGEWLVVAGPLAGGDRVVTRGNERLQPGQAVRGEPLEYPVP